MASSTSSRSSNSTRSTRSCSGELTDGVTEELTRLKQEPGKDIAIFGSSDLTVSLLKLGLVDELRIMVSPVVFGAGKSLFRTADETINLKLRKTRVFDSGNVLHCYLPA